MVFLGYCPWDCCGIAVKIYAEDEADVLEGIMDAGLLKDKH